MERLFRTVLEMSITGSWVILAVLLARLVLRRLPKRYSYALWAVAGFRLCCPFSFESVASLFSLPALYSGSVAVRSQIAQPQTVLMGTGRHTAAAQTLIPITDDRVSGPDWMTILAFVWIVGVAVMIAYSLFCHVRLRLRLRTAVCIQDNIRQSEQVASPFIMGVFRPCIYLPWGIAQKEKELILAHEKCHLKHFDHVVKLFAYLLLTVHWFNPFCHLAFRLLGKDMEMHCDEAVLEEDADRHDYSATLVAVAVKEKTAVFGPLAFGESAVKSRVKNILRWKKPKVWMSVVAVCLCALMILACAADPAGDDGFSNGKYIIANGETGEDAGIAVAEIRNNTLYIRNGVYDLNGKSWQKPPFTGPEWETALQHLEGAAPETLKNCQYMELFVLTDETVEQWRETIYRDPLGASLPESGMNGGTRTFFLLRQGSSLFYCDHYQPAITASSVWPWDESLAVDRLVEPGGKLDPTTATFTQLDGLMKDLLSASGDSVEEKAEANEKLYRQILHHDHIRWYLCHVLATEGVEGEKGELAGLLFEDVLMRRFEEPLLERGDMEYGQYFESYMKKALEYYGDGPGYMALNNASGPMLYYLQFFHNYGK